MFLSAASLTPPLPHPPRPPGCGGGGLHADGSVQPASPTQPAQPLLRPGGQRASAGGQSPAAERHGERCWAILLFIQLVRRGKKHDFMFLYFILLLFLNFRILLSIWLVNLPLPPSSLLQGPWLRLL